MDYKVTHDKKNHKFTITTDDLESYLSYKPEGKKVINFYSTYVPLKLRGKGIAAILVEHGLQYAAKNKMHVIPSCSYVSTYINRNEKYKELVETED